MLRFRASALPALISSQGSGISAVKRFRDSLPPSLGCRSTRQSLVLCAALFLRFLRALGLTRSLTKAHTSAPREPTLASSRPSPPRASFPSRQSSLVRERRGLRASESTHRALRRSTRVRLPREDACVLRARHDERTFASFEVSHRLLDRRKRSGLDSARAFSRLLRDFDEAISAGFHESPRSRDRTMLSPPRRVPSARARLVSRSARSSASSEPRCRRADPSPFRTRRLG